MNCHDYCEHQCSHNNRENAHHLRALAKDRVHWESAAHVGNVFTRNDMILVRVEFHLLRELAFVGQMLHTVGIFGFPEAVFLVRDKLARFRFGPWDVLTI